MQNLSLTEAIALAIKSSKEEKDTVYSIVEQNDGDFEVRQGLAEPFHSSYRNGKKFNMSEVSEKGTGSKVASAPKKSSAKKASKKSVKKAAGKKGPDQPFGWIVEAVKEGKLKNKEAIKKALLKDYSAGTANTQMSRINRCPNLTVKEDGSVKYKA